MDFSIITARIATGAAISSPDDVSELVRAGFNCIVDARAEMDDAPLLVGHPETTYLWNPTDDDGKHKPPSYWQHTLEFALPLLSRPGKRIYMHCAAGVNRGPSNAACVLLALGWTMRGAEATIKAARPQANIAYLQDAADAVRILGYC